MPRKGTWAEISGDVMLQKLICMVQHTALTTSRLDPHAPRLALAQEMQTIDNPYTGDRLTIDPRNLAQRILEARAPSRSCRSWELGLRPAAAQIRVHLAKEFVEDLKFVKVRLGCVAVRD